MDSKMQWFKFYGSDWLHDMKIITMLPIDQLVFVYLLSLSSISEIPGTLKRCKEDILLKMFHLDGEVSAFGCVRRLEDVGIIDVTECNEMGFLDIEVINFRKRQERALTTSERQAIYREKSKTRSNEIVTGSLRIITDVTKRNETVTLEERRVEESRGEKRRVEEKNTNNAKALVKQKVFSLEGVKILKAFESVDAKNSKYYGVATQREACDRLIKQYGCEQVLKVISFLPKTNQLEYFPHITTPCQLEYSWVKLRDGLVKEKKKNTSKLDLSAI